MAPNAVSHLTEVGGRASITSMSLNMFVSRDRLATINKSIENRGTCLFTMRHTRCSDFNIICGIVHIYNDENIIFLISVTHISYCHVNESDMFDLSR